MRVFFIGSYPPPVHGQSLAFKHIVDHFRNSNKYEVIMINHSYVGKPKWQILIETLLKSIRLFFFLLVSKADVAYISISRTFLGSIKDFISMFLLSVFKVPYVIHTQGADLWHYYSTTYPEWYKKRMLNLFEGASNALVLLPEMQDQFLKISKNIKTDFVYNPYDKMMDSIDINEVFNRKMEDKFRILYFSNLMYSKGILNFIEASLFLVSKYDDLSFDIAGMIIDDEYKKEKEIHDALQKVEKTDRIVYQGAVYQDKKIELLASSDIYVLPSFYRPEGFPLSISEAMRMGNAIVTTDHNYLGYIVNDKMGRVINAEDTLDLINKLEDLISDRQRLRSIQRKNIELSINKFSLVNYQNKLEIFINNARI